MFSSRRNAPKTSFVHQSQYNIPSTNLQENECLVLRPFDFDLSFLLLSVEYQAKPLFYFYDWVITKGKFTAWQVLDWPPFGSTNLTKNSLPTDCRSPPNWPHTHSSPENDVRFPSLIHLTLHLVQVCLSRLRSSAVSQRISPSITHHSGSPLPCR